MTDDPVLNQAIRSPPEDEDNDKEVEEGSEENIERKENTEKIKTKEKDDEKNDQYLRYKSKIYIVKVSGDRLNHLSSTCYSEEQRTQELNQLCQELSNPFTFIRRGRVFFTTSSEVTIIKFYQDEELKQSTRPDMGWCVDLCVKICEGKHHQIRRMIRRSDLHVYGLCRVCIASILRIESVPNPGDCRWLEEWEVDEIYDGLGLTR